MTEEDEAFEDLAKRQGDWGMQGSRKHQIMRYAENVESKGTSMTPTPKLRFVERLVPITETTGKRVRILQQYWEDPNRIVEATKSGDGPWVNHYRGEWRDVPLEIEQGDKHDD
jgi:hypothetical protein